MPSFKYRARDPEGKAITGLLEGDDKASVAEQIQRLGYIPVEIELEQKESVCFRFHVSGQNRS